MTNHWLKAVGPFLLLLLATGARAQYSAWQHSGSLFILTTPDGANLLASASEKDFPLLVRLKGNFLDFRQAQPHGDDIRFTTDDGKPLAYEIDTWDAAGAQAAIWVRIPQITGNARQELRIFWGNPYAKSESSGQAVFNSSNGYVSVQHLDDSLKDAAEALTPNDTATRSVPGIIGSARHFTPGKGISFGDKLSTFPTGSGPSTSEAWIRAEQSNGTILAWGNEQAQGKVVMQLRSPPHINMDCYFSGGNVTGKTTLPLSQWVHVVHTYQKGDSRLYINGVLDTIGEHPSPPLNIRSPAHFSVGGWYHNYNFAGDIDEVRISNVARSADWIKLEYENQKPLQALVGPIVQPGNDFSVSLPQLDLAEGKSATITAKAGGAQKIYWVLKRGASESTVAVDQLSYTFNAGRVTGDTNLTLQLKAVCPGQTRSIDIPITVREQIPDPVLTLQAPAQWNGRDTIEVVPAISNLDSLKAAGAANLNTRWTITGGAVLKRVAADRLILQRSQFSGTLHVAAAIDNGGAPEVVSTDIAVSEPAKDAWVQRTPDPDEQPVDHQFYARDDTGTGTLFYNGTLDHAADSVFLRLYADDQLVSTERQPLANDRLYSLTVKLKPGLIHYKVEFGATSGATDTLLRTVTDLVCGDAFLIQGQSNALATDTREESPLVTSPWIRSYAGPSDPAGNLWCEPVWKTRKEGQAELGYWGMELAKRLVETNRVPIFIINGAVGGTRIDQHQRNDANPTDLSTIYGRTLWRAKHAKLTHGIRAIIWHQGENDQGADGPTGTFGWQTYQQYFIDLTAAWKQDYPNVRHYYVFQIWPDACAMGTGTSGDMLREVQRTLPRLYSNLSIMSTVGVHPSAGCHYPLEGWAEFARLLLPLIQRDFYGQPSDVSITPPNLVRAFYGSPSKDTITLRFDQPITCTDATATLLFLDDAPAPVRSITTSGSVITLRLAGPTNARFISYLLGKRWDRKQANLIYGANHIAALTFCDVAVVSH